MAVTVSGPDLPADTCRRRLNAALAGLEGPAPVHCAISWFGPAGPAFGEQGAESTIQALSGLMAVHGWDGGRPRRLGLEVASVAAGVLAANGALASLIGALRGVPVAEVGTSVLQGGLLLVAHHIAAATADGELLPSPPGPEPGPPFRSADDRWYEIEVFDAEVWKAFWAQLGAGQADLGRAWTAFRSRYYRGRCSFPPGLHQAAAGHTLAQTVAVARQCGVSLSPVRSYAEVLDRPGWEGRQLTAVGTPVDAPAQHRRVSDDPARPLTGIRLVEATNRMQGPLAGLLLQMLGADVIRVEPPGGDVGRMVPPACGEVGSFFQCYNRGKRSVEIDLTTSSGRDELRALLGESDAFLHNWRPGRAEKWGLDHAGVAVANRRLVYAAASGWGDDSGNADLIGTDFLVQAYAGFGDGLNPVDQPPRTSRALLTDCLGALVTCEGILAGLYHGTRTGRSFTVSPSLLEGAMAAQAHVLDALAAGRADAAGGGGQERRGPEGRPIWGPLDQPIEGEGGCLVVSIDGTAEYGRLCQICDLDASPGRSAAIDAAVAERLATGPAAHWQKLLVEGGIPCALVTTDLAAMAADQRFSPLLESLSDTCRAPANPWTLSS